MPNLLSSIDNLTLFAIIRFCLGLLFLALILQFFTRLKKIDDSLQAKRKAEEKAREVEGVKFIEPKKEVSVAIGRLSTLFSITIFLLMIYLFLGIFGLKINTAFFNPKSYQCPDAMKSSDLKYHRHDCIEYEKNVSVPFFLNVK